METTQTTSQTAEPKKTNFGTPADKECADCGAIFSPKTHNQKRCGLEDCPKRTSEAPTPTGGALAPADALQAECERLLKDREGYAEVARKLTYDIETQKHAFEQLQDASDTITSFLDSQPELKGNPGSQIEKLEYLVTTLRARQKTEPAETLVEVNPLTAKQLEKAVNDVKVRRLAEIGPGGEWKGDADAPVFVGYPYLGESTHGKFTTIGDNLLLPVYYDSTSGCTVMVRADSLIEEEK